jgi:hypothetical protein
VNSKTFDLMIGYSLKFWLPIVLAFVAVNSTRACGQEEPKIDNIKTPTCRVVANEDFTAYTLKYALSYTDDKPHYALTVETSNDLTSLLDRCKAFLKMMISARIDESVQNAKADLAKKKDEHYFLRVQKLGKK